MKHSYLLAGTTLGKLLGMLFRNGFTFYPAYFLRLLFLLQNGIWASVFKLREREKFKQILKNHPLPTNPIFIIGHWRTGSTFLHQLLSIDNQLAAPSVFQVSIPDSFLVSEKYYKPVMRRMMGAHRPMDRVKLGFDEPQEDEYALLKLAPDSPLEKLIFPDNNSFFLNGYKDFYPKEQYLEKWKMAFFYFVKKLSYRTGKQIILKNPFHSLRIPLLNKMFPDALFIHIHRHPFEVIPSTVNMWNIVGRQNQLKKKWNEPEIGDIVNLLDRMYCKVQNDLNELPKEKYYEVEFSEFEKDPVGQLNNIYEHFGMTFSEEYLAVLKEKLNQLKGHKKNKYVLSEADRILIKEKLNKHFVYYNYKA